MAYLVTPRNDTPLNADTNVLSMPLLSSEPSAEELLMFPHSAEAFANAYCVHPAQTKWEKHHQHHYYYRRPQKQRKSFIVCRTRAIYQKAHTENAFSQSGKSIKSLTPTQTIRQQQNCQTIMPGYCRFECVLHM